MYHIEIEKYISDDLMRFEQGKHKLRELILKRLAQKAVGVAQNKYLTGQVLNTRSGRLKNSGFARMEGKHSVVGFATKYAAIHEFGGDIYPRRAKALKFQVGGRWVTTQHVKMPKRPYASRGIKDVINSVIGERIARGAFDEWKKGVIK